MHRFVTLALASTFTAAGAGYAAYAEPPSTVVPAAKSQDPRARVTCRRFARSGSLVDSYRVCKTEREWRAERENVQQLSVSASSRTSN